jgi:hypothetical protein
MDTRYVKNTLCTCMLVDWLVGCFVVEYFSKSLFSFIINSNMYV